MTALLISERERRIRVEILRALAVSGQAPDDSPAGSRRELVNGSQVCQ